LNECLHKARELLSDAILAGESRQRYFDATGARHGIALICQPRKHLRERCLGNFGFGKRRTQIGLRRKKKSQLQTFGSTPFQEFVV
jgi:hypothetical protein